MLYTKVNTVTLLALVGYAAASPVKLSKRDDQIIGYRRVSKEQAEDYNNNGLSWSGMRGEAQIGQGVYTAYARDVWEVEDDQWYCVISADKDAMNRVSKAWVPKNDQNNDNEELWYGDETRLDNYIKRLEDSWDPKKTIRLSIIDGYDAEDLQLLITPDLVSDASLGLKVVCKEKKDDIADEPVNYDDWQENIKGDRGEAHPA
ncbi:hypothetical protein F5Y14DRAFT_132161 [Nemania sp. NC0429]|nr:hypothetical protein F5Y14DRAFT_132161 [Nemania sp. NC0429]